MRLTYQPHALCRAEERGLPVFLTLPRTARLVRFGVSDRPGPTFGYMVSEYSVWHKRRYTRLIDRGGNETVGRPYYRKADLRIILVEKQIKEEVDLQCSVLTTYWWSAENLIKDTLTTRQRADLRRRKRQQEALCNDEWNEWNEKDEGEREHD